MSPIPLEKCDYCHEKGHLTVDCPKARKDKRNRTKSDVSCSKRAEDLRNRSETKVITRLTTIKDRLRGSSTNDLITSASAGGSPTGRYSATLEETTIEEINKNGPIIGNIEKQKSTTTEEFFECADGGIDGKSGEEVTEQIIKVNVVNETKRGKSPTGEKCKCCGWFGKKNKDKVKK